jgi:hypothetical protein
MWHFLIGSIADCRDWQQWVEFSQPMTDGVIGNEQGCINISIIPEVLTTVLPIVSGPICNIMDATDSLLFMS